MKGLSNHYDLLNQNTNLQQSISLNYIDTSKYFKNYTRSSYESDTDMTYKNNDKAGMKELAGLMQMKTGTTIVGICCKDGIVLGADTRSTGGSLVMDKNKLKIHNISDKIYSCAAGTSADCDQITRKVSHILSLIRIENELCDNTITDFDCINTAVNSISNIIKTSKSSKRKIQSALILGGVDNNGPALFEIDMNGTPQRVAFSALGSGCTDAIAVLESARREWRIKQNDTLENSSFSNENIFKENINVIDAVPIIRKAVQAGILNDLGSGSHVDICVIPIEGIVKQWREQLLSSWEDNRPSSVQPLDKLSLINNNFIHLEINNTTSNQQNNDLYSINNKKKNYNISENNYGRKIFSKIKFVKQLIQGKIVETELKHEDNYIKQDLSLQIELIE